jgi:ERCC4-type nuclease
VTQPGTIYVDDRTGSRDLMKYKSISSCGELCRLDSADVMLIGNGPNDATTLVGVEVKSVWDVLSSANTGRLQATQIPAMLRTYDVSWLLYYGGHRVARDGILEVFRHGHWASLKIGNRPVPCGYLEALLLDLSVLGVSTHRALDMAEAAQWIGVLARWWSKPWGKHRGMHTLDRSRDVSLMPGMDPAIHQRAKVAAQLPGVGFERAVAAARHFPSVQSMINATADEWALVPGVGRVIAKAVTEAVR